MTEPNEKLLIDIHELSALARIAVGTQVFASGNSGRLAELERNTRTEVRK
jgi:hypothetical protein